YHGKTSLDPPADTSRAAQERRVSAPGSADDDADGPRLFLHPSDAEVHRAADGPADPSRPPDALAGAGERPRGQPARPPAMRPRGLPDHTVALTFDDGPDPRWTPAILDVLRRERVPATFFDVGSRVAQYPGLVRDELAAGHEVGSHTFAHNSLTGIAGWRGNL